MCAWLMQGKVLVMGWGSDSRGSVGWREESMCDVGFLHRVAIGSAQACCDSQRHAHHSCVGLAGRQRAEPCQGASGGIACNGKLGWRLEDKNRTFAIFGAQVYDFYKTQCTTLPSRPTTLDTRHSSTVTSRIERMPKIEENLHPEHAPFALPLNTRVLPSARHLQAHPKHAPCVLRRDDAVVPESCGAKCGLTFVLDAAPELWV